MKKLIIILIILTSLVAPVFAVEPTYNPVIHRPFTLQAGVKETVEIYVNRIPSQGTDAFSSGMPFDIENTISHFQGGDTVSNPSLLFGTGSGLLVAKWGFISNTPFKVDIKADPLTHEGGTYKLYYSLVFSCTINYKVGNENKEANAYIIYDGVNDNSYIRSAGSATPHYDMSIMNVIQSPDPNTFIGSAEGRVYFGFTKKSTDKIENHSEEVPDGNYSANVTLTLTSLS